jgi:EmrB/QacA subfamily drug resistance transporter
MTAAAMNSPSAPVDAARPALEPRRWRGLGVLLCGTAMGLLDLFIVNVAAPSIQQGLHAGFAQIQLVIGAYVLAYAAGLITGGRLGDRYGRRCVFMVGVAVFTLASLGCGLAGTITALIALRVAQGLGAALMLPQVLSVVQVSFAPDERPRALGFYAATIGGASIAGQLVGGGLITADIAGLGWRAVFLVNVPAGIAALLAAPRLIPESRSERLPGLDGLGVALLAVGLVALLYPLVEGLAAGWPIWATVSIAASAVAFAAFLAWERRLAQRRAGAPLLPPALLHQPGFLLGAGAVVAFYSANAGLFLLLAYHLQEGLGLDPLQSGLVFLPLGLGFGLTSLRSGQLVARRGPRILVAGAGLLALGVFSLIAVAYAISATAQPFALLPGLMVAGIGGGVVAAPLIRVVLGTTRPQDAGAASGVLLTLTQTGNALGVALLGAMFTAVLGARPGTAAAAHKTMTSFAHAFGTSLAGVIILSVLAGLLLLTLATRPRPPST